jgi:hypothetical protein
VATQTATRHCMHRRTARPSTNLDSQRKCCSIGQCGRTGDRSSWTSKRMATNLRPAAVRFHQRGNGGTITRLIECQIGVVRFPMPFLRSVLCVLLPIIALGAACKGDGQSCPDGSEGCRCYGNRTCDGTLICGANNECRPVGNGGSSSDAAGASGTTGGGSVGGGTAGISGVLSGGSGGASVAGGTAGISGVLSGGSGGASVGGGTAGISGVFSGGSGGAGGSSQAGALTGGIAGSGQGGSGGGAGMSGLGGQSGSGGGGPRWSPCFQERFPTCNDACASFGATCVAAGCGGGTWFAWGSLAPERCETFGGSQGASNGACSAPLNWSDSQFVRRCCCGTK